MTDGHDETAEQGERRVAGLVALGLYGAGAAGVLALLLAAWALLAGDLGASATALGGAGLACGLLANALLRR